MTEPEPVGEWSHRLHTAQVGAGIDLPDSVLGEVLGERCRLENALRADRPFLVGTRPLRSVSGMSMPNDVDHAGFMVDRRSARSRSYDSMSSASR